MQETRTEAVGVFDGANSLQDAIDELLSSGFDRAEISLLASEHAVEEKLEHAYKKAAELEDDPTVPRVAYVSTESIGDAEGGLIGGLMYVGAVAAAGAVVATGGTLAGVIAVAAMTGGAGGLIGSVLAKLVGYQRIVVVGQDQGRGARAAGEENSLQTLRARCPHSCLACLKRLRLPNLATLSDVALWLV
jgi:hypothetical protein